MLKIEIYQDGSGEWRWRAFEANNRIIADSAEGYVTFQGVERAVDNVMVEFRADVTVVVRERRRSQSPTDYDPTGVFGDDRESAPDRRGLQPDWIEIADYAAEGEKARG